MCVCVYVCVCLIINMLILFIFNGHYILTFELRHDDHQYLTSYNISDIASMSQTYTLSNCLNNEDALPVVHRMYIVEMVVSSLIPFVVMSLSNIAICVNLYKSKNISNQSANTANQSRFKHTSIILGVISITFFITTFPLKMINVYVTMAMLYERANNQYPLLRSCFILLNSINHAYNFVLYCVTGTKFRNELKAMCGTTASSNVPTNLQALHPTDRH